MKIRNKYVTVIKKKLCRERNFNWFFRQLKNAFLIPLTVTSKRCITPPILCALLVTYRCNMRCIFCDLPAKETGKPELPEEKFKEIINELSSMGSTGVSFTGGEPLLRQDIFNLIHHAKKKNIATQLTTNGLLLTRETCKKLIDAGLDDFGVSLESHLPDVHNRIRGAKGAWHKVVEGIENFVKIRDATKGITDITISTVINRDNLDHIREFVDFCKGIGVNNISFGIVEEEFARGRIDIKNPAEQKEVVKYLIDCVKNGYMVDNSIEYLTEMTGGFNRDKPCWAGYHSMFIDCYGDVFPCFYYAQKGMAAANITNSYIKDLWYSRIYHERRKSLLACHKCFVICEMELNNLFNKFNIAKTKKGVRDVFSG